MRATGFHHTIETKQKMSKSLFELNEETHIYTLNGQRIVGATEALSLVDDRQKDPYYLLRGKYLHRATELYDRDELDFDTVDPSIQGRFTAWVNFRKDTGFTPTRIEVAYYHPQYLYGFRIDRQGPLNGSEAMIDLKSSPSPVDKLQGAAYREGLLAQESRIECEKVFDIYLVENGRYKLERVTYLSKNFLDFLAILQTYRWREENR